MTIQEFIKQFNPCRESKAWLLTQPDIETAWRNCQRPDWMLWALQEANFLTEVQEIELTCRFVRETPLADGRFVVDLLTDDRSVKFLKLKEAWVKGGGGPKPEGWDAARDAARAAAWAAARAGAWDGAWDGARDVSWDGAWDGARDAAWAAQCDIIRSMFPSFPFS